MAFLKSQIARYAGGLPVYAAPGLSGVPYIAPDQQSGDLVDFVAAQQSSVVYPPPSTTNTIIVNGTSKGAAPYTITDADVTAGTLSVLQNTANAQGFANASSVAINPVVVQRAWDQGLLGANTSGTTYYSVQQFLNNAGQGVRQPFYAFNSTTTNYSGSLDANGWPTSAFSALISAQIGGLDGQLPAGTYNCSIRSVGQAATISALQSCTVSGITLDADGVTTHFTVVIPFAANPMLSFSAGIQYLDIPRDGVTPTYGGPEFWATNLAFWAKLSVLRVMDMCNCTGAETTQTQRNAAFPEYGPTQPATAYSLARVARWVKAVCQYSGSRVKTVNFNVPGLLNPSATQSDNLAYQIPTMLNSVLSGVSVQLFIELGDEPWNASLGAALIYSGNLHAAETETKCLPYYPGETSNITSIVGNGDGTVTVTTSSPLSAIPLPDGSTFAITNGMQVLVNHQQSNSTWGAGSVTPDPNYATDATVVTVPVTVLTANSFKYTSNGSTAATLGATSGGNQMAFFFNAASTLIKDGTSLNLFDIGNKVHVRRTYQCQQVWSAVRPQDKFVLNLQQYGATTSGAMTVSKFSFGYARYLGAGSDTWYLGAMVAPYVKPTSIPFTGVATSGGTTITGVAWAAQAQVGDQIVVLGAGASSANLTTTVVAGSSGTTLNIADTIQTTVTAGTINYVYGPSASVTASIDGPSGVMTVTSGSGLLLGMMGNGTPATMAFNSRIMSQLSGTAGGAGTYQLSLPQITVASTTITFAQTDGLVNAMLATVPSFALTLASHIYTSLRWGKRPIVYEGGPDTQSFPNQQIAIHTNPAMGTVYTALLNGWMNQGGQEFMAYTGAVAAFNNSAEGAWSALQSYSDTSSPKYAAMIGYASQTLAFADAYGPGLIYGPSGGPGTYVEGVSQLRIGWQGFYTNGMVACSGGTTHRSLEVLRNIPRGRRYALKVSGSDSAAGTLADIYIDGTFKGTVTLANNGNATGGGTVPGDSTTLQLGELTRGPHRVMVDFPANRGSNVGIFSITLMKY